MIKLKTKTHPQRDTRNCSPTWASGSSWNCDKSQREHSTRIGSRRKCTRPGSRQIRSDYRDTPSCTGSLFAFAYAAFVATAIFCADRESRDDSRGSPNSVLAATVTSRVLDRLVRLAPGIFYITFICLTLTG